MTSSFDFRAVAEGLHRVLFDSRSIVEKLSDGSTIERLGTSFGDLDSDTELKVDRVMGEVIREALLRNTDLFSPHRITIEGTGDADLGACPRPSSELWYAIDPIDGSLNWKKRGRTIGLPITACVTVLRRSGPDTAFGDVVASAVLDLRSSDSYLAWREDDGNGTKIVTTVNDQVVDPRGDTQPFDLGTMIVFGDAYYPHNREMLARAFAGRHGWLRNPGSAAYEMACVAAGVGDGYICDRQKQHELGAGMLLVQGAGGVVTDFEGQPLDARRYDFRTQTPVVMGRTPRIHADLLELVRQALLRD